MPEMKIITPSQEVSLSMDDVLYLAKGLHPAVSRDDVTPVVCTQRWEFTGETLEGVATDRYRVHLVEIPAKSKPGTYLIPRQSIDWLIKNATFFGRRSSFIDPALSVSFAIADELAERAEGTIRFTIRESDRVGAPSISFTNALVPGKFPPVRRLFDDAEAQPTVEPDRFNMDFISGTRALASYPSEPAHLRFVNGENSTKAAKVIVTYKKGKALIQGNNPEVMAK